MKLEPNDAAVCMLEDDVPDLAGILAPKAWVERKEQIGRAHV